MPAQVLSSRELNRATLARQLLLVRHELAAVRAIEHLVGMQAQAPNAPYVGLWTRLTGFDPAELARLIMDRLAVRGTLQRGTVRLVAVEDFVALRPMLQPVLRRALMGTFGRRLAGIDLDTVLPAARELLARRPCTRSELAPLLAQRWPNADAEALSYAVVYLLPNVQVPPRGVWSSTGPAAVTLAETWLRRPLDGTTEPGGVLLRYLGAFGPASVNDAQTWSGLTRLREVAERLRPRLRSFRDETGRELLDLPDAPRPDPETPAPPRFLPEYDNILLSHADRNRLIDDPSRRVPLPPGMGGTRGTVLVDGFFRATWKITRDSGGMARLVVKPFARLTAADTAAIAAEGTDLLRFAAADASDHDVQIVAGGV